MQTQVQQLQEQMTAMQRSFDERMGVMKNLVEVDTDAVNKVANALNAMQTTLQKQQADGGTKTDQLSGQIQALNDTMDEIKVRLAKVTKQLEDMQSAQQSLAAQQATQQAAQQAAASAPPPDVLYNNALRDYNGGKNDLAFTGVLGLREVLSEYGSSRELLLLFGRNSVPPSELSAGGAELRSGAAEFPQRQQGGVGAAEEGILADRTRQAG